MLSRLAGAAVLAGAVLLGPVKAAEEPVVLLADNTLIYQTIAAMPDGGFVIVAQELVAHDVGVDPVLHIFRADRMGRRIWNHVDRRPGVQMALASAVDRAGDVFIGGLDGSEIPTRGGLAQLLLAFDPSGRVTVDELIGGANEDTISGIVPLSNGDMLTAGKFKAFAEEGKPVRDADVLIQQITPSGRVIWSADMRGRGQESYPGLAAGADGGFYVSTITESRQLFLSSIDLTGERVDDLGSVALPRRGQIVKMLALADGGFLVGVNLGDSGATGALAIKLDSGGNQVWRKTMDGNTLIAGMTTLPSGNIVISGTTDTREGLMTEAWVRAYDLDGNETWSGSPRRPVDTQYGTNEPVGPDFKFETRAGGVASDGAGGIFFSYMPLSRSIPSPVLPLVVEHMQVE